MQEIYFDLIRRYCTDVALQYGLWENFLSRYSEPGRFYHTVTHIERMVAELQTVKSLIQDWDTVLFSAFYHDIVYDPKRADNEELSAKFAKNVLFSLNYSQPKTERCIQQIIATKMHSAAEDSDTNFLLDADVAILGTDWEDYKIYADAVRKEFSHVPDAAFRLGRSGVMQRFLSMQRIYQTSHFYDKYEAQARLNIKREMER